LSALRSRKDDMPLLIEHFSDVYNQKNGKRIKGLDKPALRSFLNYHWPGNDRELVTIQQNLLRMDGRRGSCAMLIKVSMGKVRYYDYPT